MSGVTRDGLEGVRPGREATVGVNIGPGGDRQPQTRQSPTRQGPRRRRSGGGQPMVPKAEFQSYYGKPIINKLTWEAPDIPGYLFLGGLAGAGSVSAAWAQATGKPSLARVMKTGASAAGGVSVAALIHDLGRRTRFLNMLRTFKVTSPMSVGSWLLAAFEPAATVAAVSDLTGIAPRIGTAATVGAAALGPAVATYTAALLSDTAVPSWHDCYEYMPFVFAASSAASAGALGLIGAPVKETRAMRRLAVLGGASEMVLEKVMETRSGLSGEPYEEGKAKKFNRAGQLLMGAGVALGAVLGGRSRLVNAASGAAVLTGSALLRFGIFHAGLQSAMDPKYTVVPQRQRLQERAGTS